MNQPQHIFNQYLQQAYPCLDERKQSLLYWLIQYMSKKAKHVDPASQLNDIVHHGCISGCIGEVVYTRDCVAFYQHFEAQIWELVFEFRQETGQTLGQFLDGFRADFEDEDTLKVYLGWFAIEQTAFRLLSHYEDRRAVA